MKLQEVLKHCVLMAVMFGLPVSVWAQETVTSPEKSEADITSCSSHLYMSAQRVRAEGKEARQRASAGILHVSLKTCKEKGFNNFEILSEKNYPRKANNFFESQCFDAKINCFSKAEKSEPTIGIRICAQKVDRNKENYHEDDRLNKKVEDYAKRTCNDSNFDSYKILKRRPHLSYESRKLFGNENDRLCAAIHLECFNK